MRKIFFSYSHKDEELRNQLETHLAMLKHEGAIQTWHDRRIVVGDEFEGEIDRNLESADIVLLLVSADFLASRYCYDIEVRRAVERAQVGECKTIPIILRPCDWHSAPFGKLLAAPADGKPITKWADRDEAFLDVVRQIRNALGDKVPLKRREVTRTRPTVRSDWPRSSNLRTRREFSDVEKDKFLADTFEYMYRFFENSLSELKLRNEGVEGTFTRIDADSFRVSLYRGGKSQGGCLIRISRKGDAFGQGITYSNNASNRDNSFNESLSVETGEQDMFLRPLMSSVRGGTGEHLSQDGASEYFWAMLVEPLQR